LSLRVRDLWFSTQGSSVYRKSRPFLHFHEDPAGIFADVNVAAEFERFAVNTRHDWTVLLSAIDEAIPPEPVQLRNLSRRR